MLWRHALQGDLSYFCRLSGYIRCSAKSEMQIVTLNFTKYGLFNAEVVDIGNDAVEGQQAGAI